MLLYSSATLQQDETNWLFCGHSDDQKELIKDDATDINNGLKKSASKSSVAKDSPV